MSELLKKIRMRTWAEIDLDNLEYNFRTLKSLLGNTVKICCVVKADGYGHSAPRVSHLFEELGADYLAVSNIEEALQLRQSGISLPILILGYTPVECAQTLAENNVSQCVYSYDYGLKLAQNAKEHGIRVKIHIKIDTGMGRIGCLYRENDVAELSQAAILCKSANLIPEGIFTHFATADEDEEYTREQFSAFSRAIDFLSNEGIIFDIYHCANSHAALKHPEFRMDMARIGLSLYGLTLKGPDVDIPDLRPVMSLKSVISHVKTLKKGESVSYGRKFTAPKDMRVATVPVGYADGLMRSTADSSYTLKIFDKSAKILGRICMDQLLLDVTDIDCAVGDIVTIFDGRSPHTASDLAEANGTIPYEIICSVGKRVPRAFIKDGNIVDWSDAIYQ